MPSKDPNKDSKEEKLAQLVYEFEQVFPLFFIGYLSEFVFLAKIILAMGIDFSDEVFGESFYKPNCFDNLGNPNLKCYRHSWKLDFDKDLTGLADQESLDLISSRAFLILEVDETLNRVWQIKPCDVLDDLAAFWSRIDIDALLELEKGNAIPRVSSQKSGIFFSDKKQKLSKVKITTDTGYTWKLESSNSDHQQICKYFLGNIFTVVKSDGDKLERVVEVEIDGKVFN